MKNPVQSVFSLLAIFFIALLTTGCPVGISYPLGDPGTEKIDKDLLGVWVAAVDTAEMLKIEVGKKDDYTYWVEVLEQSENYMMDGTSYDSWVTKLDGETFIYSKPTDPEEEDYYLYHYQIEGKKLVLQDVGLLVGGVDAVTSTEAFREEVSASLKLPDCLSARFEYVKQ
jgi:hypothetical protein